MMTLLTNLVGGLTSLSSSDRPPSYDWIRWPSLYFNPQWWIYNETLDNRPSRFDSIYAAIILLLNLTHLTKMSLFLILIFSVLVKNIASVATNVTSTITCTGIWTHCDTDKDSKLSCVSYRPPGNIIYFSIDNCYNFYILW